MLILSFAGNVQLFAEPQLIGAALPGVISGTWSLNQLGYEFAFKLGNFGASAAISLVLLLTGLIAAYAVILPVAFYPFGVYLTFIFYKTSMPPELLDAGRVDGANETQLFWFIGLPLSRALLGLLAFLSFSSQWNNYFLPFVMLNDDRLYTLPVGVQV